MKNKNKIKGFALMLLLCLAVIFTTAVGGLLYFGGFGTGESADSGELKSYVNDYHYMGSLGEGFSALNRLLPMSTREFQIPSVLYNSMIYVTEPSPTVIEPRLT